MKKLFVTVLLSLVGSGVFAQIPIRPGPDTTDFLFFEGQVFGRQFLMRQQMVFDRIDISIDQTINKTVQFVPRFRFNSFRIGNTPIVTCIGGGLILGPETRKGATFFEDEIVTVPTWTLSSGILFATYSGFSSEVRVITTGLRKEDGTRWELLEVRLMKNISPRLRILATLATLDHFLIMEAGTTFGFFGHEAFISGGFDFGNGRGGSDGFVFHVVILSIE